MIPDIKNENDLRKLAGLPIKEMGESLDNIIAKHREPFESVMRGESALYDHDEFFDELYEYYVNSGEMPYGIAKARDGDPDQWIQEELDREYGDDFATDDVPDSMDGDFDSGMASAGFGTDEDYGYYGESKEPKTFKEHLDIVERRLTVDIPGQPTRDLSTPITGAGIEPKTIPMLKKKMKKTPPKASRPAKRPADPLPKKKARPMDRPAPKALPKGPSDSEKELMKPNPSGYEEFNLSRAKRGIWPGALLKATQKYHSRDR